MGEKDRIVTLLYRAMKRRRQCDFIEHMLTPRDMEDLKKIFKLVQRDMSIRQARKTLRIL